MYFLRGDVNQDGKIDISDPIVCLSYLFHSRPVGCIAAMDAAYDGKINIGDPIRLLMHLFGGKVGLSEPFPECGLWAEPTALSCEHEVCRPQ